MRYATTLIHPAGIGFSGNLDGDLADAFAPESGRRPTLRRPTGDLYRPFFRHWRTASSSFAFDDPGDGWPVRAGATHHRACLSARRVYGAGPAATAQLLRLYLLGLTFAAIDQPLIFAFYARTIRSRRVGGLLALVLLAAAVARLWSARCAFRTWALANSINGSATPDHAVAAQRRMAGWAVIACVHSSSSDSGLCCDGRRRP